MSPISAIYYLYIPLPVSTLTPTMDFPVFKKLKKSLD